MHIWAFELNFKLSKNDGATILAHKTKSSDNVCSDLRGDNVVNCTNVYSKGNFYLNKTEWCDPNDKDLVLKYVKEHV